MLNVDVAVEDEDEDEQKDSHRISQIPDITHLPLCQKGRCVSSEFYHIIIIIQDLYNSIRNSTVTLIRLEDLTD